MDAINIGVRLAQYGSLLSLFGLSAFATYAPRAAALLSRYLWIACLGLLALAASAASLFVLAANMAGDPTSAADPATLWAVISGTGAGWAWGVRIVALVAALGVLKIRNPFPLLVASGVAVASLAWAGHAAADVGLPGAVHVLADILHLLAGGVWVGALIAFVRLVFRGGKDVKETAEALASFAGVGSVVVAVLVSTGVVSLLYLTPWRPLPDLTTTLWGWLLIIKLAIFVGMFAMAAANRFVLTPRLQAAAAEGSTQALAGLKRSLIVETALAFAIVALVSVLGTLAPPVTG